MVAVAALLFFLQASDFSSAGLKALDEKRYGDAVQAFQKAVAADSKDYTAHFNLALAYGFLHRDAEGIAEYRKTLELKPGLYEAQLNGGILLLRGKRAADALTLFAAAAAQKPAEFRPRYYLAESQLQTGDLVQAEASFRAALAIDARSAAAELGLAHALARQDKLADAAPHFRQAAQLDHNYHDSLLELADLYEKNKQPDEAMALYRQFPDDPAVQAHIGELMLRANHYAEAIPGLEQAYGKEPTEANRVGLAMAYLFTKQFDKALPLLEKAAAEEAGNYEIQMMYARALRDARKFPAAAAQFNLALQLKPNEVAAWSDLASALYMAGDLPKSLAAFQRAEELGEDTAGNWFMRAIMLDKLRQLKPAVEAYNRFLTMSHGEHPDQEFQARQRVRIIKNELEKR